MGSHVFLEAEIWPFFGGGLGAVSSVGYRFCRLGTEPTKNHFGRTSAPPASFGKFGIFLAHRNRVCVAQISCSDDVGWFHPSFSRYSLFTGFCRGLGEFLGEISRPPGARNGPKMPKNVFSRVWEPFWAKRPPTKFDHMIYAAPVNPVGVPCDPGREIWPDVSSVGARFCQFRTRKKSKRVFYFSLRFQKMCFQARNGPQTLKRWIFPVLGAVLGETPADQI